MISSIVKKELVELSSQKRYLVMFLLQSFVALFIVVISSSTHGVTQDFMPPGMIEFAPLGVVGDSELVKRLELIKELEIIRLDFEKALDLFERDYIPAFVVFPKDFHDELEKGHTSKIILFLDGGDPKSVFIKSEIENLIDEYSREITEERIGESKIQKDYIFNPVVLKRIELGRLEKGGEEKNTFGEYILLLVLLLPLFTSANLISDSIVGEKERGTLEILLSSPASRSKILSGKVISILILMSIHIATWILFLELLGVKIYNHITLFVYLLLTGTWLIGIGVVISAYANSIKEASLVFSFVYMFLFFLLFVPLPLESAGIISGVMKFSPLASILTIAGQKEFLWKNLSVSVFVLFSLIFLTFIVGKKMIDSESLLLGFNTQEFVLENIVSLERSFDSFVSDKISRALLACFLVSSLIVIPTILIELFPVVLLVVLFKWRGIVLAILSLTFIEEFLKPVGLYSLSYREKLTIKKSFLLGAISGFGFASMETFLLTITSYLRGWSVSDVFLYHLQVMPIHVITTLILGGFIAVSGRFPENFYSRKFWIGLILATVMHSFYNAKVVGLI
ncbi:MAG: ABC transporter permease [Candidatus Hydrothermarchaeota archaeon]